MGKIKVVIILSIVVLTITYLLLVDIKSVLLEREEWGLEFVKLKFYLLNAFFLSMVGQVVVSVAYLVTTARMHREYYDNLYARSIAHGLVFTAVLTVFVILRLRLG